MSKRAIVTYAAGAHEELLDVALPTYKEFARRHGYELIVGKKLTNWPPAWNKVPLLLEVINSLHCYTEVVWFDCDLVIVDSSEDFPSMKLDALHAMVRHYEGNSEVPNSGVWRLKSCIAAKQLLNQMLDLEVFKEHGWWEQAALLTLMGYCVPPQDSDFKKTKCRCVQPTVWYRVVQDPWMRLCWNSHPNYQADHPRIVHCSYPDMPRRLEVMRALVKDPHYKYPKYEVEAEDAEE